MMEASIGAWNPELLGELREPALATDRIFNLVGERYHVTREKLEGRQRSLHVAFVRQVVMWLMRECTELSYPEIGRLLNRDHSTAIHGHGVVEGRMGRSAEFRETMEWLKVEAGQ